jgi:putative oxidoreductase
MYKSLNILSRALIAAIFVISGFGKVMNFQQMVGYGASAGLPVPTAAIAIAAIIELGGGLAFLLGWQIRWISVLLILFLIPTTLIFHVAYLGDHAQSQMQMAHALKNLAIMGGLLKFHLDASPVASRTA